MRRVIIGTVFLIVIFINITALAAQGDFKESLQSWYAQVFQQKSSTYNNEVAKQITSMNERIHSYLINASKEIDHELDDFLQTSTATSKKDIQSHQEQYNIQLTETKKHLLHELKDKRFMEEEKDKIADDMENIVTDIIRDILNEKIEEGEMRSET